MMRPTADVAGDEQRDVGGASYRTRPVGAGHRPAVLVVDMASSVADPDTAGSLPSAVRAAGRTRELLDAARLAALPIFFTVGGKRWFTAPDAPLTQDERGSWPWKADRVAGDTEHACATMTVAPQLGRRSVETVVSKSAPSALFDSPLGSMLRRRHVDELIVCGVHTTGCVLATVIDAFSHGFRVSVVRECLADSDPAAEAVVLGLIARKYADVVSFAQMRERVMGMEMEATGRWV